jgi:hypothetical protein
VTTPRSANLREFPRRTGIVINYDQWRLLMREFIDEVAGADNDLKVQMEWTLETFLQWAAKKQKETANGKVSQETSSN